MSNNERFSLLIVDDEEPILNLLSSYLEVTYECTTATSAREALRLMESRAFDVVLTDYLMPDVTGLELCEAIRERHPGTAVLFVSGSPAFIQKALQCGLDFITKPFLLPDVEAAVKRALEGRSRPHPSQSSNRSSPGC